MTMELVANGAVCIRGNHDQMFLDALDGIDDSSFIYNGGMATIESYTLEPLMNMTEYHKAKRYILDNFPEHIEFLRSLPYYHEEENYIFVHAGLHPSYDDSDWKKQSTEWFIWIRNEFLSNPTNVSKTVIHGHTPTCNFQETGEIMFGDDKINVDGGGVFGYQFNLLAIEDGKYTEYSVKGKRYM